MTCLSSLNSLSFSFLTHLLFLLQARVTELECEAEELRQLWKSSTRSARPNALLLSSSLLLSPEEESSNIHIGLEVEAGGRSPRLMRRCDSERLLKPPHPLAAADDASPSLYDHECSCVRRAEVVKFRGISLLNEVDAQYSALQVKYEELLRRCHPEQLLPDAHSHKSIQTAANHSAPLRHLEDFEDDFHQPEYKELFQEIFSRIQKTKEDLIENRGRGSVVLPVLQ